MVIFARTLATFALALVLALAVAAAEPSTAIAGSSSPVTQADSENLADEVRAFKAEKFREIDEAILELRDLIDEKARALVQMEAELRDAQNELMDLERLASFRSPDASAATLTRAPVPPITPVPLAEPATSSPTATAHPIPGTLDDVVPASAALIENGWQGLIRIVNSTGGRLDLLHESGDGSGNVQAGALQAEIIEIRVASPQDARVISQALKADSHAVVTWPDLRVAPESPHHQDGRIDAMETTLQRIAERLEAIDQRNTSSPSTSTTSDPPPSSDDVVIEPPNEIPPAPSIPD